MAFEDLVNMDKIWCLGVIRYLQKKELAPKKIHAGRVATLEDDAIALLIVKKWAAKFNSGGENLEDGPRLGRFAMATTQENIQSIYEMVINDRHLTINHVANVISICDERMKKIFHKELDCQRFWLDGCPSF